MASYLSFRINGGPPSAAFIEALARLSSPTVESVRAVLSEHFGDESIRRSASSFLSTWLDVPRLSDIARDEVKHPENTADYAVQLQRETYDVLLGFVAGDAPTFSALLTRPFRSDHVADPTSDTFGSVGRPGVLSLPGVLAAASSINHTNVPRRGRFILKSLFCETLPNPPPNAITQQPPLPETASERERFERVEQKAGCGGCHERINRIAYPFEVYDELGRTRLKDEKDNTLRTDAVHKTQGGAELAFRNVSDLMTQAAASDEVRSCFAKQAFRHFARRDERRASDNCALESGRLRVAQATATITDAARDTLIRTALARRGDSSE